MSTNTTTELKPDDVIDERYRILQRLGRGGMGTVYEAEQVKLKRKVALKVLLPQFAVDETAAKRFEREARTASSIDHRNVVKILDFGHLPTGELYYTMEILSGRDLSQLLRESGALPWSRAGWIILQVVRAFAAIHAQNIVHRDIKPANCFLLDPKPGDEVDFVKILDFGIANLQEEGTKVTALTGAADIIGSVLYMAPEQIMAEQVDARTDVYSLGVMMYELLTGQVPFRESNMMKVMLAHQQQAPRPPRELVPGIPPEVEAVILRAMAKSPGERFQAMVDIEAALAPLVEFPGTIEGSRTAPRVGGSVAWTNPSAAGAPQRRWARPLVILAVVFVAAIALTRWLKPKEETLAAGSNESATTADDVGPTPIVTPPPRIIEPPPPPEKQFSLFDDPLGGQPLAGRKGLRVTEEGLTVEVPLEELLPPEPWTLEPGRMAGTVLRDKERPLASARVCAWMDDPRAPIEIRRVPNCTVTDRRGRFSLIELEPGIYDVHVFAKGFLPLSLAQRDGYPLTLQPASANEGLEFVLAPGGVEVKGTVKSGAGNPIQGARVAVVGPARALAEADAKGRFTLWVAEGDMSVVAWADGYSDVVESTRSNQALALQMTRESVLLGRVLDSITGEPIKSARVRPGRKTGGLDPVVYTDEDGQFKIPGLTPGTYQPNARYDDSFVKAKEPIELEEARGAAEVVLALGHREKVEPAPSPAPEPSPPPSVEEAATGGETTGADESTDDGGSTGSADDAAGGEPTPPPSGAPDAVESPDGGPPKPPPPPKDTNASRRAKLAKSLKRCGSDGTIEVSTKLVLADGRLFKPKIVLDGVSSPDAKPCADKLVGAFRLLRSREVDETSFKPLLVKL